MLQLVSELVLQTFQLFDKMSVKFHTRDIFESVCIFFIFFFNRYGIKLLRNGDAEPGDVSSVCIRNFPCLYRRNVTSTIFQ